MMISALKYSVFVSCLLILLAFPCACTEEQPALSRKNKITSDSLFRVQEKLLQIEIDSLCELNYAVVFERAKDSIAGVRLKEIEAINNR